MDQYLWMKESPDTLNPNWNYLDYTELSDLGELPYWSQRHCMWKSMHVHQRNAQWTWFQPMLQSIDGYRVSHVWLHTHPCPATDSEDPMPLSRRTLGEEKKSFQMMMIGWMNCTLYWISQSPYRSENLQRTQIPTSQITSLSISVTSKQDTQLQTNHSLLKTLEVPAELTFTIKKTIHSEASRYFSKMQTTNYSKKWLPALY